MKKMMLIVCVLITGFVNAQAFKGKGDIKGQVGALFQDGATGLVVTGDFGLGENISVGFVTSYLLNTQNVYDLEGIDYAYYDPLIQGTYPRDKANFTDRFDIKARFNANIGNVFGFDKKMDIYPGLDIGFRNLGAHVGFRYFFTNGFGVYSETGFPIAKYNQDVRGFQQLNNQFTIAIGASFNL
jgi:hypothetical protein